MAMPTSAHPPLAFEMTVEIDPKTPYAATMRIVAAELHLQFVTTRATLEQLLAQISDQLQQAPIPAGPRSKDS